MHLRNLNLSLYLCSIEFEFKTVSAVEFEIEYLMNTSPGHFNWSFIVYADNTCLIKLSKAVLTFFIGLLDCFVLYNCLRVLSISM